jgi:cytochrome b subunit of formate dehydrogenase
VQHFLMMACFLVLAFTGLPQRFSDWGVSQWLISMWGGLDSARTIHRFAGLVMILDCIYHLGYIAYGAFVLKKPLPIWMIPVPKDVTDLFHDLQYWFGRSSEKPKFGRFSYREKFDYWAIFWGMPVIGLSGLLLMFPVLASRFLPGDAISVAFLAHSDEAVLAVLWIFIVHLFFVHFNPRFFPLNRAIFTGKMPRHLYVEEHPLELAALDRSATHRTGSHRDPPTREPEE